MEVESDIVRRDHDSGSWAADEVRVERRVLRDEIAAVDGGGERGARANHKRQSDKCQRQRRCAHGPHQALLTVEISKRRNDKAKKSAHPSSSLLDEATVQPLRRAV